jgi:hypothetical protein
MLLVFQPILMVSKSMGSKSSMLTIYQVTYLNSGGQVGDVLKAVVKCDKCRSPEPFIPYEADPTPI